MFRTSFSKARIKRDLLPMLKDRRFWISQTIILLVALTDILLDRSGFITHVGLVHFLPITLYWVPVMLLTFNYGLIGSLAASAWVVVVAMPNWIFLHQGISRYEEIALIFIMMLTSLLIGVQVDKKMSAERRAKMYSAYSVNNQEQVFKRLSLDIHDETLQRLMAACQQLDIMQNAPLSSAELIAVRNSLEKVVKDLRVMARDLRPSVLEDLGMVPAIRQLSADFTARTRTPLEFKVTGREYKPPSNIEMQVYRIAQEALRNVEKHARAGNVALNLTFSGREIRLDVIDDGIGFDVNRSRDESSAANLTHFGIMGMQERAESIHGLLKIHSQPGKGTQVSARIPGL